MEAINATLILKALDGLALRSAMTAHNIANANSPGYQPVKVSFEDTLKAAVPKGADAINATRPQTGIAIDSEGNSLLRLDQELATATATSGRYGALVEILNRQLQIQALAVSSPR